MMPQDKLNELIRIRNRNGAVMFVGDGINDAPVLAGAEVGAAMGSGADAAIEAADVVFMNSSLTSISDSIEIAREATKVAMQNVVFARLWCLDSWAEPACGLPFLLTPVLQYSA